MPVTRELQIPKALSPAFFPKYLDSTLGIPVLRARSTSSHFSFDLDGVVVLLGDPAGHYAIPPIPVASLCHHSSVPLELGVLSVPNLRTPRISIDNELPHLVACHAQTYIGEDLMEVLQLRFAPLLLDDPSILTKTSEIEGLVYAMQDNEGCLARGRWELFEIWSSISFNL